MHSLNEYAFHIRGLGWAGDPDDIGRIAHGSERVGNRAVDPSLI